LRPFGEIDLAAGVADTRRKRYIREPAAEIDPFAYDPQPAGQIGVDQDFVLIRGLAVVVARPDRRHRPKSNPSRSPASSPVALTCCRSAATNALNSPTGTTEIRSSWWRAVRTAAQGPSRPSEKITARLFTKFSLNRPPVSHAHANRSLPRRVFRHLSLPTWASRYEANNM